MSCIISKEKSSKPCWMLRKRASLGIHSNHGRMFLSGQIYLNIFILYLHWMITGLLFWMGMKYHQLKDWIKKRLMKQTDIWENTIQMISKHLEWIGLMVWMALTRGLCLTMVCLACNKWIGSKKPLHSVAKMVNMQSFSHTSLSILLLLITCVFYGIIR